MKYSRIPRVNRQAHGLILVGIIALIAHCIRILIPFFSQTDQVQQPCCAYEIISDSRPTVTLLLEKPESISRIMDLAGVHRIARCETDLPVPCDRSIRLTGNASEIIIGNISGAHRVSNGKKVDLNAADESDLRAIPGIGPVLAGRIVSHRESIGGFTRLEELKSVAGIRTKKFSQFSRFLEISDSFYGQKHVQSPLSFSDPPAGPHE
jgi:competence protein ComEA